MELEARSIKKYRNRQHICNTIYIDFQGSILDLNWMMSNRSRCSGFIHTFTLVFHLCNVILFFQAVGVYGLSGHLAL